MIGKIVIGCDNRKSSRQASRTVQKQTTRNLFNARRVLFGDAVLQALWRNHFSVYAHALSLAS